MKDLFDALRETGINEISENMIYEYEGYIYILRREPKVRLGGMVNVPR